MPMFYSWNMVLTINSDYSLHEINYLGFRMETPRFLCTLGITSLYNVDKVYFSDG